MTVNTEISQENQEQAFYNFFIDTLERLLDTTPERKINRKSLLPLAINASKSKFNYQKSLEEKLWLNIYMDFFEHSLQFACQEEGLESHGMFEDLLQLTEDYDWNDISNELWCSAFIGSVKDLLKLASQENELESHSMFEGLAPLTPGYDWNAIPQATVLRKFVANYQSSRLTLMHIQHPERILDYRSGYTIGSCRLMCSQCEDIRFVKKLSTIQPCRCCYSEKFQRLPDQD